MGVFDRLRRLLRSNVNDMVKKAEDPEKMLNQLIVDMNKQLTDAKRNVATAISEEKRLFRQVEAQKQAAADWEKRAMTALRAGEESLARQALERKQREDGYVQQLSEQYDRQHVAVESLKGSLRDLQDRIEDAQRKKTVLVARAKRAEAQKKIQEVITGLGDSSAFEAFDEMSKRVEQMEVENEAIAELSDSGGDRSLEDQIAALERPSSDQALEDLRQKMALEDQRPVRGEDPVDDSLAELKRKLREEAGQ